MKNKISYKEYQMIGGIPESKVNKYGAKRTIVDGISFPSKLEANRYSFLKNMAAGGSINGLELQPTYPIEINGIKICVAKMDFLYFLQDGTQIVEDTKGMDNRISAIKRKLVKALYGVDTKIVKKFNEPVDTVTK